MYSADGYCGGDYETCDLQIPANVHFEEVGCQFMADQVVQVVTALLGDAPRARTTHAQWGGEVGNFPN